MPLDVEKLLAPVSADAPCGEDIGYDTRLMEMENLVSGKKDTQFAQAEEPDWRSVQSIGVELLGRSKHLRPIVLLTVAGLRIEGAPGLRDGLRLLSGVVENFWPNLWPALDPDDNNDPTERLNIIVGLSPARDSFADALKIRNYILDMPMAESRQMGRFTLRDVLRAAGELPAVESGLDKAPDLNTISSAYKDTDPARAEAIAAGCREAYAEAQRLDAALERQLGAGNSANLETLLGLLKSANTMLGRIGGGPAAPVAEDAAPAGEAAPGGAAPAPRAAAPPGEITSHLDVHKAIDKICEFYSKHEPSSPVPILLKRAKRLVGKDFEALLKDLTPDAVRQLRVFSGDEDE
jgi:type VI secretion system protein ImpA